MNRNQAARRMKTIDAFVPSSRYMKHVHRSPRIELLMLSLVMVGFRDADSDTAF